ncbi:MAG: hypothetical protein GX101_05745 [Firmicutes bacterium]|jgi:butyrate kinase|nr:hypothetical protein [Bacillota bacterium]
MKQVFTDYLLFHFLWKEGLPVSVLAIYPQSSTLHLALGRSSQFKAKAVPLLPKENGLIKETVLRWLREQGGLESLEFIVTSGYLSGAEKSGLYSLSSVLPTPAVGGAPLAQELSCELEIPAYLIDPTCPQECFPQALIGAAPEFPRACYGDGFILKYLSRLEGDGRYVVAHLDETVQIGALAGGRILDMGSSAHEGPFAFSQAGGLPFEAVLDLCESVKDKERLLYMIEREGGFKGFLPSVQFSDLLADQSLRDSTAEDGVWQVFVYQVAKEIAAYATALEGKLDAVLLTGQLVNNETFLTALEGRIGYLGRLTHYPGNQGLNALLTGAERVFSGESILIYQ